MQETTEPDLKSETHSELDQTSRDTTLVPESSQEPDDTELMVKVADEISTGPDDNVDYDPFLENSGRATVPGLNMSPPLHGDVRSSSEKKDVKEAVSEDEEPEWLFIGGSQRHKTSGTNMSAETSNFIMKKRSVTRMKDGPETPANAFVEGQDGK